MKKITPRKNKILFLFSRSMLDDIVKVKNKEIPSEILYGAIELEGNGWLVEVYDVGNKGLFGKVSRLIRPYGINIIGISTMRRIIDNDIILVKNDFSLMTTLFCRLLGKKIIYMDAMFNAPRRFWKRWSAYINLRLASTVIAYSEYQARIWEKEFGLRKKHIKTMHYCVDADFYPHLDNNEVNKDYAISIGRDTGRNYITLSKASRINGIKIKLITLPYLLKDEIINNKNIEILQNVPYDDLFELYRKSSFSIVPLSKGLDYPTGIRGILESLALGVPTIATRTPVLEEYFQDREEIIFVDAENEAALSDTMIELINNVGLSHKISTNGMKKTRECYNMQTYKNELETIIVNCINS